MKTAIVLFILSFTSAFAQNCPKEVLALHNFTSSPEKVVSKGSELNAQERAMVLTSLRTLTSWRGLETENDSVEMFDRISAELVYYKLNERTYAIVQYLGGDYSGRAFISVRAEKFNVLGTFHSDLGFYCY